MRQLTLSFDLPSHKKGTMFTRKLGAIALPVLICAALWIYRVPLVTSLHWFSDLEAVTISIKGYGLWGPAILSALFILQTFVAFIPGQALMVASGYVYGFTSGILITWASLVIGGQAAFWLARCYGRPFAERWISVPVLDRWDKSTAGQGILFYIVTLVLPFFPNDAMCYVAGLGNMSFRRFLIANILGRGIASFLTVLVGAFADQITGLLWFAVLAFIVLGLIGWVAARRFAKS